MCSDRVLWMRELRTIFINRGRTPDEVYARQANEEKLAAYSNPVSTLATPPFCPAKRDHLSALARALRASQLDDGAYLIRRTPTKSCALTQSLQLRLSPRT